MRISDWSSDVCSSDLQPDRPQADRAAGRRPGQAPQASAPDDARRVPCARTARLLRDGACLHGRLRHPRLPDRAEPQPDLQGLWRSEEHTSELQSLMRISYAVFCLKKKKNTKLK